MGKLSGAEKKVVPVGSNWREARHLTNTCPMLLFRNKSVLVFPALRAKVAAQPSETLGTLFFLRKNSNKFLLVQVFPSETQNALPSEGRERFLRNKSIKQEHVKRATTKPKVLILPRSRQLEPRGNS